MAGAETESFTPVRCIRSARCCPMDRQLAEWKLALERIWSAAAPDYRAAACLVADIANASEQTILRQAATQALRRIGSACGAAWRRIVCSLAVAISATRHARGRAAAPRHYQSGPAGAHPPAILPAP